MKRRRFLAISAASLVTPGAGRGETTAWQAQALGGLVRVDLRGARDLTRPAIAAIAAVIEEVESAVSLFRADSALVRLNRIGRLQTPPATLQDLLNLAERLHAVTAGQFDPTVQPLWQALSAGRPQAEIAAARGCIGWGRVTLRPDLRLAAGQALTFNGVAQGYAADRVAAILRQAGFGAALIDMGEFVALGGPFSLGIEDPDHGMLGTRRLLGGALATSSPRALPLPGGSHILSPSGGRARWSSITVEADSAALADGLSTAFCLMPATMIRTACADLPEVRRVTAVTFDGDLLTL